MTVETPVDYIDDLNASYPAEGESRTLHEGNDHIRNIKKAIKQTFPNVSGAVLPTHTELNYVDGVTSAIQTQLNSKLSLAGGLMTGNLIMSAPSGGSDGYQVNFYGPNYANAAVARGIHVAGSYAALGITVIGAYYFSLRSSGYGHAPYGWTADSDGRVKKDRAPIYGALDSLEQITGYTFTRSDLDDGKRHAGLIAQEVQGVLPEAVVHAGKAVEGQPDDMLGLDYNAVIALLVNAVKELRAEVEALKCA